MRGSPHSGSHRALADRSDDLSAPRPASPLPRLLVEARGAPAPPPHSLSSACDASAHPRVPRRRTAPALTRLSSSERPLLFRTRTPPEMTILLSRVLIAPPPSTSSHTSPSAANSMAPMATIPPPSAPEVRALLGAARLFKGLPDEVLDEIGAELEWWVVGGGETVCAQGDVGDYLYLVASGRLAVVRTLPSGEEVVLREAGRGETRRRARRPDRPAAHRHRPHAPRHRPRAPLARPLRGHPAAARGGAALAGRAPRRVARPGAGRRRAAGGAALPDARRDHAGSADGRPGGGAPRRARPHRLGAGRRRRAPSTTASAPAPPTAPTAARCTAGSPPGSPSRRPRTASSST